jgi:hypothetical protein
MRKDIELRIASIAKHAHDYERAHGEEDDLRQDFLTALSDGSIELDDAREFAELVLSTSNIAFGRHCA